MDCSVPGDASDEHPTHPGGLLPQPRRDSRTGHATGQRKRLAPLGLGRSPCIRACAAEINPEAQGAGRHCCCAEAVLPKTVSAAQDAAEQQVARLCALLHGGAGLCRAALQLLVRRVDTGCDTAPAAARLVLEATFHARDVLQPLPDGWPGHPIPHLSGQRQLE
eukprot:3939586-Rhodomonas_salina.1